MKTQMPDGLILNDSFHSACGCTFGDVDPVVLGVPSEPGQIAFVCVPCSKDCPAYVNYLQNVGAAGADIMIQARRA